MGRTVSYDIKKDGINKITPGQWKKVEELQKRYNSEYPWQCESLGFQMVQFYPHWENFKQGKFGEYKGGSDVWDIIRNALNEGKTIKQLEKQGMIWTQQGGYKGEEYLASGFTKTYEEDQDAEKVIEFLVQASKILKKATISVYDEGDSLGELYINITAGIITIDEFKTKQHEKHLEDLLKKGYDLFGDTTKALTILRKSKKRFKNTGEVLNNNTDNKSNFRLCPYCGKHATRPHSYSAMITAEEYYNEEIKQNVNKTGYPDPEGKYHKHNAILQAV